MTPGKTALLRILCVVAAVLAVGAAVLALLPGLAVYRDLHHCASLGIAGCTPRYELLEVRRVVDTPGLVVAFLVAMLAPAAAVWWRPLLRHALLWSLLSIGTAAFALALSFVGPAWDLHHLPLWPQRGFDIALCGLLVVQIAVVPIACGIYAWATHTPRVEPLARAWVHRVS